MVGRASDKLSCSLATAKSVACFSSSSFWECRVGMNSMALFSSFVCSSSGDILSGRRFGVVETLAGVFAERLGAWELVWDFFIMF